MVFALQTRESWAEFIGQPVEAIQFGGKNFELYFEEPDFDHFYQHLQTFPDLCYATPLKEYPWGQRVVRFYDPDRHIIEVGESMKTVVCRFLSQGMSLEEAAQRSQYPLAFVKRCQKALEKRQQKNRRNFKWEY